MGLDGFERLRFDLSEAEHRQLCVSVRKDCQDMIEALKRDADALLPG